MKKLSIIAFGVLLLASCEKKKLKVKPIDPPAPIPSLYDCHQSTIWNDSSTKANLLGNWVMTKMFSPWVGVLPAENVMLSFVDDSTLIITQDTIVSTQHYHIEMQDSNIYSIVTNDFSAYTYGKLFFCADSMECSSSEMDGVDYFYRKAN